MYEMLPHKELTDATSRQADGTSRRNGTWLSGSSRMSASFTRNAGKGFSMPFVPLSSRDTSATTDISSGGVSEESLVTTTADFGRRGFEGSCLVGHLHRVDKHLQRPQICTAWVGITVFIFAAMAQDGLGVTPVSLPRRKRSAGTEQMLSLQVAAHFRTTNRHTREPSITACRTCGNWRWCGAGLCVLAGSRWKVWSFDGSTSQMRSRFLRPKHTELF